MGWLLALLVSVPLSGSPAEDPPLPSRSVVGTLTPLPAVEPASFDLIDFRQEERDAARPIAEIQPHTIFGIKRHVGVAGGYDNGIVHGSVGLYITVAEIGRWNFGTMAPEVGLGHYPVYDDRRKQMTSTTDYTIFISLASVHYRVGYLRSIGMNWYINVEQIFDVKANMPGSQVGISFSRK